MTHKLNLSHAGKSWKLELEPSVLNGKSIGNKIQGKEIKTELDGYEFEITGGSDFAGFPMNKNSEGIGRKKVILTKGFGMHKKPKGLKKKKVPTPKGLRLRKTLAGNTIHDKTVQVNLKLIKEGNKKIEEIFPEQNKPKEREQKTKTQKEKKLSEETKDKTSEEELKVEKKAEEESEK